MNGRRSRAIRRAARALGANPTEYEWVQHRDGSGKKIAGHERRCKAGSFRAMVKMVKREMELVSVPYHDEPGVRLSTFFSFMPWLGVEVLK